MTYSYNCPCTCNYSIRGGGVPPGVISLGTKWCEWSASSSGRFAHEESQDPLNRRLCGPQGRSGCFREEKDLLSLPGSEPRSSVSQPVACRHVGHVRRKCRTNRTRGEADKKLILRRGGALHLRCFAMPSAAQHCSNSVQHSA